MSSVLFYFLKEKSFLMKSITPHLLVATYLSNILEINFTMDRSFRLWQPDESKLIRASKCKHDASCGTTGSLEKKSCVTRYHSEMEHNKSNVHFSGKHGETIEGLSLKVSFQYDELTGFIDKTGRRQRWKKICRKFHFFCMAPMETEQKNPKNKPHPKHQPNPPKTSILT